MTKSYATGPNNQIPGTDDVRTALTQTVSIPQDYARYTQ